ILLSETSQPIAIRDGNFSYAVFAHQLEQSRELTTRGRESRANIREHQRFASCSLGFRPPLQALDLCLEIILLSLTADPPVQDQESFIGRATQTLNFGSGNARFQTDPYRLDFALLDPPPDRER